jgi:hypothetical protein
MVALGRRPGIVCTLADLRSMALRLTHDLLPTGFQADPIKINRKRAFSLHFGRAKIRLRASLGNGCSGNSHRPLSCPPP